MIYKNIIEAIGKTPLVQLSKAAPAQSPHHFLTKCEFTNPGGSIKDRIGYWLIEDAEKKGLLKPGGTVVEATSGNTGMGLAIAAAVKGYKTVFVLPDKMSMEKIKTLRAFGAKVIVTPTAVEPEDPRSHYSVSRRIAEETPNAFLANQYHNLANREAHYHTTGPEIWEQTGGKVDYFFAGMGTGGTISGVARFLKEKNPQIKIIGVDPVGSILYDYFKSGTMIVPQSYKVEGIGEDMLPDNLDFTLIDDMVQVSDMESFPMTRRLLLQEGLFVGVSAGAAVAGAMKYMQNIPGSKNAVIILPDSGNRYLSKVFDDDWMRENGFLGNDDLGIVSELVDSLGLKTPVCISSKEDLRAAVDIMKAHGISQLPVIERDAVIGVLSESDVLKALVSGRVQLSSSVMSVAERHVSFVLEGDGVRTVSTLIEQGITPLVLKGSEKENHKDLLKALVSKIDLISFLGRRR